MSNDFLAALKTFGHRACIVQCSPNKKKKRNNRGSSIVSPLKRFALRFCLKQNAFYIEAFNLSAMYQLILDEEELSNHLTSSGLADAQWDRYLTALSSACCDPSSNIKLTRGKGGGYMKLALNYPFTSDINVQGTFELVLLDDYGEDMKEDIVMELLETTLAQRNSDNQDSIDSYSDNHNSSASALKSENLALQTKIQTLEQEVIRLKAMAQNTNSMHGMSASLGFPQMSQSAMTNTNPRKRKKRDETMSLMNPRREKRRKKVFQFAG
eukprot:140906_1